MWLLKTTSAYHRPAHLAGAVALGLLAGIIPKTNLTAVLLYAGLILLPIHSLLGILTSLLATRLIPYSAESMSLLGTILLHQPSLQSLWIGIDSAPVLPWLGLHNTLVLGSLVFGIVFLTPVYLICLRFFESLAWNAATRKSVVETAIRTEVTRSEPSMMESDLAPIVDHENNDIRSLQPAANQLIPAPKLLIRTLPNVIHRGLHSYGLPALRDHEISKLSHGPTAIINHWHMGYATDKARTTVKALLGPTTAQHQRPDSAKAYPHELNASDVQDSSLETVGFQIDTVPWEESHPLPNRPEITNSLEIAHNAGEVLDWAEQALTECLAEPPKSAEQPGEKPLEESTSSGQPSASAAVSDNVPENIPATQLDADTNDRWLLETTIEIVRLSEPTSQIHSQSQTSLSKTNTDVANHQSPSDGDEAIKMAALITKLNQPNRTSPNNETPAAATGTASTETLLPRVLANLGSPAPSQTPLGDVENKTECLGYLLGHLRQLREGSSS